jgi:hypothetical protein
MGLTNSEFVFVDVNNNLYGVSGSMPLPVGAIGQLLATVNPNTNIVEYLKSISGSLLVTGSLAATVIFPSSFGVFPTSPSGFWSEGPQSVSGSQLTGSTFSGYPVAIGGVYYGSGNVGNLPAFLQTIQTDVSGAVYVTTTGSLPVYIAGGSITANVPQPLEVWQQGVVGISGSFLSGSAVAVPIYPVLEGGLDQNNVVRPIRTDPQGRVTNQSFNSTVTSVTAQTTNQVVLTANPQRVMAIIFNEGSGTMYIKLGTGASTASYTAQIAARAYYEVPGTYSGEIDAVWSTAVGVARITELF